MRVLVTGAAGFIGYYLSRALLEAGNKVVGIDNLNTYYDVNLKKDRLKNLAPYDSFEFSRTDIADSRGINDLFKNNRFDMVVNLAAQAGVRYSIENPGAYVESNLVGFANILEACRHAMPDHLIYASSSSVYGGNRKMPFSVKDMVDHPVSLYAATKKSNELMAHAYAHLYGLPVTGLRFFTVYGPWGRPDMAYFKFTRSILEGRPIDVYNNGNMKRDFTCIDDIVKGVVRVMHNIPVPGRDQLETGTSAPFKIYNIGHNRPVPLMTFIETLEDLLGKKAEKNMLPLQPGDVPSTYADIGPLTAETGFKPRTPLREGLSAFVKWYKSYYK
ncbi:MAG: NAD-dependent epimerase [Thermodesulfobacteriota bacterium]|nr:NAD-dependent epimerase [Thermodesulfobacteriota bacterium]